MLDEKSEIPWPKKGDKVFVPSGPGEELRSIRHVFGHDPSARPEAFKHAADMVVDGILALHWRKRDRDLIYPVAYLYRHAIELVLKDILRLGVEVGFFTEAIVADAVAGHRLASLWNLAKKLLDHRWPGANPGPLKAVEAILNELHGADPNGQVFRYDTSTSGRRHRNEKLPTSVSLSGMRKTMDRAYTFLTTQTMVLRQDIWTMEENRDSHC